MAIAPYIVQNLQGLLDVAVDRFGTLAAVAGRIEVAEDLLDGLANGSLDGWSTSKAEALARAVGVDPASIWDASSAPSRLDLSFLRGAWPDFHPSDVEVFTRVLERAATLRALRAILGLPKADRAAFLATPLQYPYHRDGYELARRVRAQLGLNDDPAPNLHLLVPERFDIEIAHEDLDTARLRAAALVRSDAEAIVLNDQVERDRVLHRRSIAHELCHILFDQRRAPIGAVLEGKEDSEPHETRANAFAAEFLVPEGGLISLVGMPDRIRDAAAAVDLVRSVSAHFSAPTELVANHLVNNGYVAKPLREDIIAATKGLRIRHPERRVDVLAARLGRAVADFRITPGRANELRAIG